MPRFTLSFTNSSNPSVAQSWTLTGALQQTFPLAANQSSPPYQLELDADGTVHVDVAVPDTEYEVEGDLNYSAGDQNWSLDSDEPGQFALSASGNNVRLDCSLTNQVSDVAPAPPRGLKPAN
jgi:hypothetical protein